LRRAGIRSGAFGIHVQGADEPVGAVECGIELSPAHIDKPVLLQEPGERFVVVGEAMFSILPEVIVDVLDLCLVPGGVPALLGFVVLGCPPPGRTRGGPLKCPVTPG
jgi:hypothetical protein